MDGENVANFFTETQRQLQREFQSEKLADRIVEATLTGTLSDEQSKFIDRMNMFFLATVDENGFPSSSYKGGERGFVRVLSPTKIVFPNYDGNGMFLSMGNVEASIKVGLLFVDFEIPQRIRVRGEATCLREGSILKSYPGANLVVEVNITDVWVNCPRYIHPMQTTEPSPYLPNHQGESPLALWKRVDLLQDVLSNDDRKKAQELGLITIEDYELKVSEGILV
ncbi:MAG TPA: pyridoxamine 5'-phosphate oxidase [Gammaproteobacteria bacterium]|jgi:predicted pyridoxine 5'-phosphate oxidase superfamily flavin-nucleotide-binding protein|nr:pyridoxamine 5'-phosphate oxidase [Gammaproteobacteria bacterium]|tara:strand:- start:160 stop:831 length:672 start_codon:yes stop_codon:yes gene_type:complete